MACASSYRARPMQHARTGFPRGKSFVKPTTVNMGVPKTAKESGSHWGNLKEVDEFEKEKKEHPEFDDRTIEQIVEDHEKSHGHKITAPEVAGLKINNRKKALWFARKARDELKEEKPDYKMVHYYTGQARYYNRLRPVYASAFMVKKKPVSESKEQIAADYASV